MTLIRKCCCCRFRCVSVQHEQSAKCICHICPTWLRIPHVFRNPHLNQGLPSTSPLAVALVTEALHPGCGEHAGFGCWSHSPATQWDRVPMLHGHQEADLGFCRLPLFARINGSTTQGVIHSIRVFIRKCPINGFCSFEYNHLVQPLLSMTITCSLLTSCS